MSQTQPANTPARIAPDPSRRTPNGFCVECGVALSRKDALRCRQHGNRHTNRRKPGTIQNSAQGYILKQRQTATQRAMRLELERLREIAAAHGVDVSALHDEIANETGTTKAGAGGD